MPNSSTQVILAGGEDLVSSGIEIQPGRAQLLYNYYCDPRGGYAKVPGYEAFDGAARVLTFESGDGVEPATNNVVTIGSVSADVVSVDTTSGTWAGGDAAGTITFSNVTGGAAAPSTGTASFSVATSSSCTVTAVTSPSAVPGSGDVKGVWVWDGDVYAIRSDGTNDILYKATSSGWTAADVGYYIAFNSGGRGFPSPIPVRGDTLTKGGVTATIAGVSITSGDFESSGTAAGFIYVYDVVGGNFSTGTAEYNSDGDELNLTMAEAVNTLGDGNTYEFRNENFSAVADDELMYFVNGVDPAWQYDGNCLVPINSGVTPDTPVHLETHGQRLFLALPGGNIMFSSPGSPTTGFTQDYTAGSVSLGSECTGMQSLVGGTLAIFGKTKTKLLSGNISGPSGNMQLVDHSRRIGAREWSIQSALDTFFISDLGVTSLYSSDKYGNFAGAGISQAIEPYVKSYVNYFVASVFIQRKGLYRLFMQDGTPGETQFLTASFSQGRMIGWSRGAYAFVLTCVNAGVIADSERVFAGSDDGFVYELEKGRSHNGSSYRTGMILPYNALGNVMVDKQWRKTVFQLDSDGPFSFSYAVEFNYSQSGWPSGAEATDQTKGGGAYWGIGIWNTFIWSGSITYGTTELDTFGVGFNMAIVLTTNSDNTPNHTMRAYSSIYEQRRLVH